MLRAAANAGRILVTHDRNTMRSHFQSFISSEESPGLVIVAQHADVGAVIEDLLLIWAPTDSKEWRNDVVFLPW